jgi:tetratricopeptide (TPR) repeat protein
MQVSSYKYIQVERPGKAIPSIVALLVLLPVALLASLVDEATNAISHQNYQRAIGLLSGAKAKSAQEALLLGRAYFQTGQFEKAESALERAVAQDPRNASAMNWLGRAQGMRADRANPFSAMGLARKARDSFEAAVKLDPRNLEAVGDLLSYYMSAPGFLGGGVDKARALAETVKPLDAAEYASLQGELAEKEKDYLAAEKHYIEAQARDPKRVGRWIDLAKFYTRRGQTAKADAALTNAKLTAPGAPRLLFDEASLLIRAERNLPTARELLRKYQASARRDDDPSPFEVEQLLAKLEKLSK